jgi:hypothetical protein
MSDERPPEGDVEPSPPPPPIPSGAAPVPPDAALPAQPEMVAPPAPPSHRGRWIAVGAVVIVVVAAIAFMVFRGGDGYPDSVAGLKRLHTSQAKAFEDLTHSLKIATVTADGAVYGVSDTAEVAVIRYHGLPSTADPDQMLQGAAGGAIGSGGSVDMSQVTHLSRNGVEYRCAPFEGKMLSPSDATSNGQVCVWVQQEDVGLVMTIATQDGTAAANQTAEIHDALS